MTPRRCLLLLFVLLLFGPMARPLLASTDTTGTDDKGKRDAPKTEGAATPTPAAADLQAAEDEDRTLNLAQPDFSLVNLPTTLRLPRFKSAFRVTHRFTRPLGQGDVGALLDNFFGFDSGALIGLEYRISLVRRTQVGIYRTSARTIQFFGQYDAIRQGERSPVGVSALFTVEGINNFRDQAAPGVTVTISRTLDDYAAFYVEPIVVGNTNPVLSAFTDDNNTFLIGLGARLRIRPTVYLIGEYSPRVAGYRPGSAQASFAIEKRAGGHTFQMNFSNSVRSTIADIARGAASDEDWYIGFNITRKFY